MGNNPINWIDPSGLIQFCPVDTDKIKDEDIPPFLKYPYEKVKPYLNFEIPGTEKIPGKIKPDVDLEKKKIGIKYEYEF